MLGSLDVVTLPWVFSQSSPLTTTAFMREAERRGITLDHRTLRDLYKSALLPPMVELTHRKVSSPVDLDTSPRGLTSARRDLQAGLATGRIRDPGSIAYRPKLRFDTRRVSDPRRWSNGLIYSHWQLLALFELSRVIARQRRVRTASGHRIVLPRVDETQRVTLQDRNRWSLVLTALEARYKPVINSEWLLLSSVDIDDWDVYRDAFDADAMADQLEVTPDQVREFAESLLTRARRVDPTGNWSRLIRRAPESKWKTLSGDALVAMDLRIAAEILLLFYEELARLGSAPALNSSTGSRSWHPLMERLSATQQEPLDAVLSDLGVSPHPGVLLVVEGETEELLVPRVFDLLGFRHSPDLVRVICMRGADKPLGLLVAAWITPLLGERRGDHYDLVLPPITLMLAIDQDNRWDSDEKVSRQRSNLLAEIEKALKAQSAELSAEDLERMIEIRPWPARCFEFAHFSDDELADALLPLHAGETQISRGALRVLVAESRARGKDLKEVWGRREGWTPKPSKTALADALWPILVARIDALDSHTSADLPPVVQLVEDAYFLAQRYARGSYIVEAADHPTD